MIRPRVDDLPVATRKWTSVAAIRESLQRGKVRESLSALEDPTPVSILEFIDSDRYLNLGEWVYPACKWMLHTFYHPRDCYDDFRLTFRGQAFEYPGFGQLGYSKEEVDQFYFNKFVAMVGQRMGKSVITAIGVLYEIYKLLCMPEPTHSPLWRLAPGTPITLSMGATTLKQSQGTVYSYVTEWRDASPWFRKYIEACRELESTYGEPIYTQKTNDFHFKHKNISVDVVTSNSAGNRGATRKVVSLDEIAHFDDGEKRSAQNMWDAMVNSTVSFRDGGIVFAISSPSYIADKINELYAKSGVQIESGYYQERGWSPLSEFDGVPVDEVRDPHMLGFHFPTWELNPELPFETFRSAFLTNPESTDRDIAAMPGQAKSPFFADPTRIDEMFTDDPAPVAEDNRINKGFGPNAKVAQYYLHLDVGLNKPSNFAIALGHMESFRNKATGEYEHHCVIDLAHVVKPQANGEPDWEGGRAIVHYILKRFPNVYYSSDGYQDEEFRSSIRGKASSVEMIIADLIHYSELKHRVYMNTIRCHSMPHLANEMKRLELVNGKKIEKGLGFTKDVADCVAVIAYRTIHRATNAYARGKTIQGLTAR